jgi:FAD/FMN-containing dehydrogenase
MVTYEDLTAAALQHGLMPAVVPELKTITLGGAAAGVGIEASSFRQGLVHETLLAMDVLTGDGRVLTCTPDNEYADLFHGLPNSYGTLGYALKLRARAVPVLPYVELRRTRHTRGAEFFAALAAACRDPALDFVDGVAFRPGELYVCTGRFVERAPWVSDYTFERIFYRSIRDKEIDYLSAADFIWRWDTDWFWCSKNVGAQNPLIRRLYGKARLGSRTYQHIMRWNSRHGWTKVIDRLRGGHSESVIQDVDIPIENAAAFLEFFQREIGLEPLWVCPLSSGEDARFPLYPVPPRKLYVNFGFWDVLRKPEAKEPGHYNRLIEREVSRLSGIKSLYSSSYFTREEFHAAYGGDAYRALKDRYDPERRFPELYDKCVLGH